KRIFLALAGLIAGMAVTLFFGAELFDILRYPYVQVMGADAKFLATRASSGFMVYLKVCLIGGLILASPWVIYQFWKFVSAGLYPRERRYFYAAVPFCVALFVGGAVFFLFVVSVPIMKFFIGFNDMLHIETRLTWENHVAMMTNMMLVFGLGFQLPVVVAVLGKMGLVTTAMLNRSRRYVIVGLFVFAAVVTSPSPVDQVLLAVPMWGLFELGALFVRLGGKPRPGDG
ncbi:MAG: twin-arginine translocase subunit TatC, partial [Phycisphaerae bacterium]|nr:twin-arginine translocase subunit TatC [Phycisphaerae bacterium]